MELKTPLYDCHVEYKGKIVPFAGYLLPVQYETGVIKEHMAVRERAGLFDVSHMGEFLLKGEDAFSNVQKIFTNDFSKMKIGQVKYSPLCNPSGGVVDDVLVYKFSDEEYFIVVNAANRHKDYEFMKGYVSGKVQFLDLSDEYAQLALQGPNSQSILELLVADVNKIPQKYYTFEKEVYINGVSCLVSRTGYTGEDGFEIYCEASAGSELFRLLLEKGGELGLIPCGLGARDTLRLEAGMPLYGHEMNEEITPMEAGLGFAAKLDKDDFIGKEALAQKEAKKVRTGLRIVGRGIAREGFLVCKDGKEIGVVTSGTHSPYYNYPIAMALIEREYREVGTSLEVMIREKPVEAVVVELPFYKRGN